MGANSVTGVGQGAAGITRGPGNGRNQYFSNLDPHVVWHGTVLLVDNVALVYLPSTIQVPPEHLAIFTSGKTSVEKISVNGIMTSFGIAGTVDDTYVDYVVMDAGNDCFCEAVSQNPN